MMSSNRRVGTLTMGLMLILMGSAFLAHLFLPELDYRRLVDFWPVVLILLGIETLASYTINKEEKLRYDGWAIVIMIVLIGFSVCMGGVQFLMEQYPGHIQF
jgi:hypothetical protein